MPTLNLPLAQRPADEIENVETEIQGWKDQAKSFELYRHKLQV